MKAFEIACNVCGFSFMMLCAVFATLTAIWAAGIFFDIQTVRWLLQVNAIALVGTFSLTMSFAIMM